jgi:hypothetical protein
LKQLANIFLLNSDSGILYGYTHFDFIGGRLNIIHFHGDPSPRGKLCRIIEKVQQDLFNADAVSIQLARQIRRDIKNQLHILFF